MKRGSAGLLTHVLLLFPQNLTHLARGCKCTQKLITAACLCEAILSFELHGLDLQLHLIQQKLLD